MGDVGDYWREHKEYKRAQQKRDDQYDAEVAAGKRPHVCVLCQRAFKTEASLADHFRFKHCDPK